MPRTVVFVGTFIIPDFIEANMEDFTEWMQSATTMQGPAFTPSTYLPNLVSAGAACGVDPAEITIFNLSAEYQTGTRVIEPTPPPTTP